MFDARFKARVCPVEVDLNPIYCRYLDMGVSMVMGKPKNSLFTMENPLQKG